MIKVVVIDDEKKIRQFIINIIERNFNDIKVVEQACDVESGINAITKHEPDIVLLDIQMPDGTGFDLLKQLDSINFKLIIITAFEQYAIKAIKFSTIDYILKPIDIDEFISALKKTKELYNNENNNLTISTLLSNIQSFSKEKRIILKTADDIFVIKVQDIIRLESQQGYTEFFLSNHRKIMVSSTLKKYDEMLSEYGFFRTHKSHLINLAYLDSYKKREGGYILMRDKSSVPVSYRKKDQLFEILQNL